MKTKRILSLFLAVIMTLSASVFSFAESTPSESPKLTTATNDYITIIVTNDVHCAYEKYDKVATLSKNADILADAGDAIQGALVGSLNSGGYIVEIMNRLGYDVATFGNHEFDYGLDRMLDIVENEAEYAYVCCNFLRNSDNSPVVEPYRIFEIKGRKIAFVGIDTPQSALKARAVRFTDEDGNMLYNFCSGNDGKNFYDNVQAAVNSARAEGADYVIALAHLGTDAVNSPYTSTELLENVSGIDVLADGHSHSVYTTEINGCKALQTGTKLENAGKITISSDGNISTELIPLADVEADPEMTTYLSTITDQFAELKNQVVARTDVYLTTNNPDGTRAVRNKETNMGDLCADAYKTVMGADIAFVNGGGVRTNISPGDITYGQIFDVNPYNNALCLAEVTGQQLLDALEFTAMSVPEEDGGFMQVSGLSYTIDLNVESSVETDEDGKFIAVTGQRRVINVMVGDEPIDPDKIYRVASNDYNLINQGGGCTMFGRENINILEENVILDHKALIEYIVETLGGVVGEEYAQAQNRITIIPVKEEEKAEDAVSYSVVKGDCLWTIAKRCYGKGSLWTKIYEANKSIIKNPRLIYVGQTITIPEI